jgi:DNA-directed RNA polymerase specialized sigma24 family protein
MGAQYREVCDQGINPEEQALRFERRKLVMRAFRRLPTRDQDLLRLMAVCPSASYRDISRRVGIPIGSIGPTRQQALGRLRHELTNDGDSSNVRGTETGQL